ncbi:MAG: ABC transporter substrate-binding protein [Proteobacteria bacterium]|nr:ABC transporter substrate-binding protein [Pseudomonadota bacterium]
MIKATRRLTVPVVLGVVAFTMLAILSGLPALAENKGKIEHEWVWTKKFPKPSWWRFDESYFPEKPVRGGYYQVAEMRYVGLMNPNHWPVNSWSTLAPMYDQLIYPDGKYRASVPWLATSWEFVNPTTVVMTLRKGVQFHDGSYFDAHGLKYQVDWQLDRKSGAWTRGWLKPIKSIEVVDEYTVRYHLKYPWAGFADIMANVPGWIMSTKALKTDVAMRETKRLANKIKINKKKVRKAEAKAEKAAGQGGAKAKKAAAKAKKLGKKLAGLEKQLKKAQAASEGFVGLDFKAVGSGRFMIEEVRPGNYVKTKRNPNWWFAKSIGKDTPYLDGVKTTVIPEVSVRLANLKAGKLDTLEIENSQYAQVKDDPNFNVYISPMNHNVLLAFNHKKGPFADIRVRKAISHAIDRKALIAANANGFGRPAAGFYPTDHYAHNPDLKPVPYNPELARKLLAQAGYAKGLTLRGMTATDSRAVRFAQIIKAMLKRVNVNWEITMHEPVAYADKMGNLEFELAPIVATYIKDPDSAITTWYDPDAEDKRKRIENPKVMAMIKAARQELDFEKRKKMYWDIEKSLYENYDDVWLYYSTRIDATRKHVRGYNREMQLEAGDAYWPTHEGWFKNGKRH